MDIPDEQLVAQVRDGDRSAYATLFERHQNGVFNYSHSIVKSADDAQDITQNAFIKVFEALPRLIDELNFSAYLYRTARNVAYDQVKAKKRFAGADALERREEDNIYKDPQRSQLLRDQQAQVRDVAGRLPEKLRTVLTLRELQEMSYTQIAAIMGVPKNTVGVLLSRARLKFKQEFRMSQVSAQELSSECKKMLPLLSAYIDNELTDARREKVKSHLDDCPLCRLALDELMEASKSYRGIIPLIPPPAIKESVLSKAAEWAGRAERLKTEGQATQSADRLSLSGRAAKFLSSHKIMSSLIGAALLFSVMAGVYSAGIAISDAGKGGTVKEGETKKSRSKKAGGSRKKVVPPGSSADSSEAASESADRSDETEPEGNGVVDDGQPEDSLAPSDGEEQTGGEKDDGSDGTGEPGEGTGTQPGGEQTGDDDAGGSGDEPEDPDSDDSPPADNSPPPTPTLVSPSDGTIIGVPEVTLQWSAVDDESGATYSLEIQALVNDSQWQSLASVSGLGTTSYGHTLGPWKERWRVWAVDGAGNAGSKTGWNHVTYGMI